MSTLTAGVPSFAAFTVYRQFSVDEYQRLIQAGILDEDDDVELLEGYLVLKMARNAEHDSATHRTGKRIARLTPDQWQVRVQMAVTLADSAPEPDIALARGDEAAFDHRKPEACDLGLVIEVADSSLKRDREDKGRIYARAGIPVYWIVNLVDRQVEVFTLPSGPAPTPAYGQCAVFTPGTTLALVLDGVSLGQIAVAELLP